MPEYVLRIELNRPKPTPDNHYPRVPGLGTTFFDEASDDMAVKIAVEMLRKCVTVRLDRLDRLPLAVRVDAKHKPAPDTQQPSPDEAPPS